MSEIFDGSAAPSARPSPAAAAEPVTRKRELTIRETRQARKLWALGLDTAEIADVLEVSEDAVYNALAARRASTGEPR